MGHSHRHRRAARIKRENTAWNGVPQRVYARLGITSEELHEFDDRLLGSLVLPGMADYGAARTGHGMSPFDQGSPMLVVRCADVTDVRIALGTALRYSWPFTLRSGGHSTAGFSSNAEIVIDLSGVDSICMIDNQRVSVGPGCTFGRINRFLKLHRRHIPTGNCDDVRAGGYVQGGGYGYTSRQFGMQCDCLVEATVLLADGRLVTASESVNPDLFWAIRGGTGNNLGIVVNLVYQTVPMEEIWGCVVVWGREDAPAALHRAQKTFGPDRGLEIGYTGNITTIEVGGTRVPVYMFSGMCIHGRDVGMRALQPLLEVGNPTWLLDEEGFYYDLNDALESKLPGPPPMPGMYEIKSSSYLAEPISKAAWSEIFDYFCDNIATTNPYNLIVLEAYGGAINRVDADSTAFIHRDVLMDIYVDAFWREGEGLGSFDDAQKWMEGLKTVLAAHENGHYYQNYPQRNMPNYRWQYWGDAYNGLLFVKSKFDPDNVFNYEQSITPYPRDPRVRRSTQPSRWSDPTITESGMTATFAEQPV